MNDATSEKAWGMPGFRVSPYDEGKTLKEVIERAKVQLIPHIEDENAELLASVLGGKNADWRIIEVENGQEPLVAHAIRAVRDRKQIKHGGWVTETSYRPVTLRMNLAQGDQVIVERRTVDEEFAPMRTTVLNPMMATA